MTKVLIGTQNPAKIKAVKQAFEKYFTHIEFEGIAVDSEVSKEPINNEILLGAKNRIKNLCLLNQKADYYAAIETGLINMFDQWMMVSICCLKNQDDIESCGMSPAFPIPQKYIPKIISTDFNQLITEIFLENSLNKGKGGISLLTQGKISRTDLSEQAVHMALITYLNGPLWQNPTI